MCVKSLITGFHGIIMGIGSTFLSIILFKGIKQVMDYLRKGGRDMYTTVQRYNSLSY